MADNFLLNTLRWLEMDPHGILTGSIGAMLSLFVVNGNSFSWRRTFLIILAGVTICGYTMPWIESKVVGENETRSLAHLLNMLVGFIASDGLSSIKSAAPTFTNFMVDAATAIIKRIFNTKTSTDDK